MQLSRKSAKESMNNQFIKNKIAADELKAEMEIAVEKKEIEILGEVLEKQKCVDEVLFMRHFEIFSILDDNLLNCF